MTQFLGIIVGLAVLIGVVFVLARPNWAFVLVMILFPLKQLLTAYLPAVAARPMLVNYAVGSVALAAMILRLFRGDKIGESYRNPVTLCILGLYALWFAGILCSPVRDEYVEVLRTDISYITLLLILLPLLILDLAEFRKMLYGLMIIGATIALLIIVNPRSTYYSGRLMLDMGMVGSIKDYGNPLAVASLGAISALAAVFIRPERATFLFTLIRVAAFVFGMGVAIGSGSRGQVLAASIVGILFFPISRKLANPKQFFLVAGSFFVLVGGILLVFKLFIGQQNVERWDPVEMITATTGRLDMAFELFHHYLASPAHWMFRLGTGFYSSISRTGLDRDYVHNVMAEVLCEHGLAGAMLFALAVIFLIRYSYRLWNMYRDDPPYRAAASLLIAICVFALLEALKQGSMRHPAPFYWWMVLAKLATQEFRQAAYVGQSEPTDETEGDLEPDPNEEFEPRMAAAYDRNPPGRDYAMGT